MQNLEKIRSLRAAYLRADRDSSASLRGYLGHVVIDSRPEPARFASVARGWQWDRVGRLEAALEALAGLSPPLPAGAPRCFWEVMPRGHDKTTGLARMVNWFLAYSRRPVEVVAASGDWDQAALLIESMKVEAGLNPWLAPRLKVRTRRAEGPGGQLKVLTADAPTSMGKKPGLFIIDEVTWWKKRDLWDVLWSGWQKVPGAVMLVISNAGVLGSWQDELFRIYKGNPAWNVYEAPGQLDTWMSPADIALVRAGLPRGFARRVLDNVWIDPAEDGGYLTRQEVQACEALGGQLGLSYALRGKPGREYLLSVDYGPKRDRTALAVLHQEVDGLIVVDRLDVWQGSPEVPIQVAAVREWIEDRRKDFNASWLVVDPHELMELVQDYQKHMTVAVWEAHGGKSNYTMAEALRTAVVNRRVAWYPGAGSLPVQGATETLLDEIPRLVIKPTPYGYRFDHTSKFHDDRAVVVGMGIVTLLKSENYKPFKAPPVLQPPEKEVFRLRKSAPREMFGIGRG